MIDCLPAVVSIVAVLVAMELRPGLAQDLALLLGGAAAVVSIALHRKETRRGSGR